MMRLSYSTLACPEWNLRQIVEAAAANGIAGVDFRGLGEDIDITRLPQFTFEIESTLSLFREFNLALPCLNTSVTLVSPASERWQMMLEECHRYAILASKTGTKFLRVFGGGVPKGMSFEEARSMAQRHLRQLVKICRPSNCQVLIETHDTWASSGTMLELLHEFDPNDAGVLWDVEHPCLAGEAPQETASRLSKYIRHVHLKDSRPIDGKNKPCLLGDGDLPLRDVAKALAWMKYDGWICLEMEKRWHPESPDAEIALPQFAQFMTTIWAQQLNPQ